MPLGRAEGGCRLALLLIGTLTKMPLYTTKPKD